MHAQPLSDLAALGRALRSVRARRFRLTQDRLAAAAGLSANHVGALERGEADPSYTTLLKLSRAVDVPLAEIVTIAASIQERP